MQILRFIRHSVQTQKWATFCNSHHSIKDKENLQHEVNALNFGCNSDCCWQVLMRTIIKMMKHSLWLVSLCCRSPYPPASQACHNVATFLVRLDPSSDPRGDAQQKFFVSGATRAIIVVDRALLMHCGSLSRAACTRLRRCYLFTRFVYAQKTRWRTRISSFIE